MAKLKYGWRGVNNPNAWFHHPRAFWTEVWLPTGFWRQWYMAIHDPIYVGLWVTLFTILALTAWAVL